MFVAVGVLVWVAVTEGLAVTEELGVKLIEDVRDTDGVLVADNDLDGVLVCVGVCVEVLVTVLVGVEVGVLVVMGKFLFHNLLVGCSHK